MNKIISFTLKICCLSALFAYSNISSAAPVFTKVGERTNDEKPSVWKDFQIDITSFISGAASAFLNFDLRNDAPVHGRAPHSTTSEVFLGTENSNFFVKFNYLKGQDSSHWRNVELVVDGLHYIDQYGANNNHLGSANWGTAWAGKNFFGNILGDSNGTTYNLFLDPNSPPVSSVPVPAAVWLFGSGLLGILVSRRKKSQAV